MCTYVGQEFGADYPDAVCIDGYLWDADSGNATADGWDYTSGGDIPCPQCNFREAVDLVRENLQSQGIRFAWFLAVVRVWRHRRRMNARWNRE